MKELTPDQLLTQLRQFGECPRIEAKKGIEIGASAMQTVCAFANEPGLGGGFLLLGVAEPDGQRGHFQVCGISNADKLLNDLQVNCREQFEQPISVQAEIVLLEGKKVICVFVPELEPAAKPCTFKGKFDSRNKRKTGVWRRGLNGDYECSQSELEPLLLAKSGMGYEQVLLPGAQWSDLDPSAISLYRFLRAKVRPEAEELQASDEEMLYALSLLEMQEGLWIPNVAGLLLFGKPLSLRRLLPAVRVDYVRIAGTQWVEDLDQRFMTTLDIREPLLRLIPKLEATILDDLPRHFHLDEGSTQRKDRPLLPQKVVREAVVNAVMHRDYRVHQPTLVVRYRNRIEIRNAGYSLKPEAMLGEMGSKLRNPILSAVLYDLNFAETKGSGIRTMRRLLEHAGLSAPVFHTNVMTNQFQATYLLHQLLSEEHLCWLKQFSHFHLSSHEAKALILTKETGAVDNAGLRAITGLDTLATSQLLGRLHRQYHLLIQGGAGPSTYYRLAESFEVPSRAASHGDAGDLDANAGDLDANAGDLDANAGDLDANAGDLDANAGDLPEALKKRINRLSAKARKESLWPVILWLCLLASRKSEWLANHLGRKEKHLRANHLSQMRKQGLLTYRYSEVVNHPEQAYITTEAGEAWLRQQEGIANDVRKAGEIQRHKSREGQQGIKKKS
ncbi:putative DNA binding domain-containing protein [Desulfurispirillum indicum]|uniref:ATP-binding protein n=1 Tax=Desulfurispirillum indicum TaxID=936456 RepID=UPI001CFA02D9|nr:ATP-binding protein [Desulfurispirillum indicum]UCZ56145.1 putative DNA binding domain-containing protein [Desulfurispirillum indicum]